MKNVNDEKLVERYLKHQDELALELLIKRYLPPLFSFVKNYTGRPDDAADITQETVVKAWKNLQRFDPTKSFKTWIFTIAKRTAIDWLKKKNALPFSRLGNTADNKNFADSLIDETASVFEPLFHRETASGLTVAIARLPSRQSAVINLRLEKALHFREIAERLEIPLNTAKSRYRRGLAALKKILTGRNNAPKFTFRSY